MLVFFGVLIILACIFLGLFVLIQNPKGGGLSGTFGGFNNQVMGVRQTTDVLEKGTWMLAAIIGALCLLSVFFIPSSRNANPRTRVQQQTSAPRNAANPPSPSNFPASQPAGTKKP
jgi:preprotein translocase subunit SecG